MKPTDKGYPIKPSMIDATKHFWDAFNHAETETSAAWVVRLCQRNGSWRPFTYAEIDGFYRELGQTRGFTFNRLLAENLKSRPFVAFYRDGATTCDSPEIAPLPGEPAEGFVAQDGDTYTVTHQFVSRCFGSSPAKILVTP